jgi:transposase
VILYFLLYITQISLLILNEQIDQYISVEIEFCVLCSENVEELGTEPVEIDESRSQIHVSERESLDFVSGIGQCRN